MTNMGSKSPVGGSGLGGIVSGVFGGDDAAKAAQGAAMAQQGAAGNFYNTQASIINPATVQGLASFDRDIKNQEKNLSRQEQLISQLDPTIIEASQQALRLLKGEQSSALGPAQNQRNQQRQKLLNQLREQLGPGAETSTAGIQALTRFDSETNNLLAGQQQSALANLGNVSAQFTSQRPDMFREIAGLSSFGQGRSQLQFQQASALGQAMAPMLGTAGAQYTGQLVRGQQGQAWGNKLFEAGVSGATAAATGGASGAAGAAPVGGGGGQYGSPRGIGG